MVITPKLSNVLRPEGARPGDIVHIDGRVLGQHEGVVGYTVGQRKGLGIGGGATEGNTPLYVIKVDAENARVIVGPREALACDVVHINTCNWLVEDTAASVMDVTVKLRSVSPPLPARLERRDNGTAILTLNEPQFGIAPGQAAVCYVGERVLGGGWITGAMAAAVLEAA